MVLKNHFAFLLSRTLVASRQLLFYPTTFVQNFLAVLLVVSVFLLVVKRGPSVLKRSVYFRENRKDKIRWHSWTKPKVPVKVQYDNPYVFSRAIAA